MLEKMLEVVASLVHNHNYQIVVDFDKFAEQLDIQAENALAHNRCSHNLWLMMMMAVVVAVLDYYYHLFHHHGHGSTNDPAMLMMHYVDFDIDHSCHFDFVAYFDYGHGNQANEMVIVYDYDCESPVGFHHD